MADLVFEGVDLDAVVEKVKRYGPQRVVVSKSGEAVTPRRAKARGVEVDVVLIRKDGWTLGAPSHLVEVAEKLWAGDWVRRMDRRRETP